jgi:hypothetical protein
MEIKFFHTLCFVRDDGTDSPHFQVDDEGLKQVRILMDKIRMLDNLIKQEQESVALCQVVGVEDGL